MTRLGGRLANVSLPLVTTRLSLRLPRASDVPRFLRLMNDPRVSRPLAPQRLRFTRQGELKWVREALADARKGRKLPLCITLRGDDRVVGGVGLEIRDEENGRALVGYWLDPRHWHRGYVSEATSAVCSLGFGSVHLHRIDAMVFDFNPRSMRLLRRLGFTEEGRRREVMRRGGRWCNEIEFGLLAPEFRPVDRPTRPVTRKRRGRARSRSPRR